MKRTKEPTKKADRPPNNKAVKAPNRKAVKEPNRKAVKKVDKLPNKKAGNKAVNEAVSKAAQKENPSESWKFQEKLVLCGCTHFCLSKKEAVKKTENKEVLKEYLWAIKEVVENG